MKMMVHFHHCFNKDTIGVYLLLCIGIIIGIFGTYVGIKI